jgi:hypothetical protein
MTAGFSIEKRRVAAFIPFNFYTKEQRAKQIIEP